MTARFSPGHLLICLGVLTAIDLAGPSARAQDSPRSKPPAERPSDDEAFLENRVHAEMLTLELTVDKDQIQQLMKTIKEIELDAAIGDAKATTDDPGRLERLRKALDLREHEYLENTRELDRLHRKIADHEAEVARAARSSPSPRRVAEALRRIEEAVDTWNEEAKTDKDATPKEQSRINQALRTLEALIKAFDSEEPK